jgi:DNA (cytosine-5)-methyltransferase 1
MVYGGFPCQDISTAGLGEGLAGKRSGLYWHIHRLAKEIQPQWVFLENVPAIRTRGLLTVIRSLADLGYDCRWMCLSAAELGAPHIRKRWFLLANAKGNADRRDLRDIPCENEAKQRPQDKHKDQAELIGHTSQDATILADPDSELLRNEPRGYSGESWHSAAVAEHAGWWETEPSVGRVVDELPHRMDRIKGLGNAVVPAQAREAFKRLMFGGEK